MNIIDFESRTTIRMLCDSHFSRKVMANLVFPSPVCSTITRRFQVRAPAGFRHHGYKHQNKWQAESNKSLWKRTRDMRSIQPQVPLLSSDMDTRCWLEG